MKVEIGGVSTTSLSIALYSTLLKRKERRISYKVTSFGLSFHTKFAMSESFFERVVDVLLSKLLRKMLKKAPFLNS